MTHTYVNWGTAKYHILGNTTLDKTLCGLQCHNEHWTSSKKAPADLCISCKRISEGIPTKRSPTGIPGLGFSNSYDPKARRRVQRLTTTIPLRHFPKHYPISKGLRARTYTIHSDTLEAVLSKALNHLWCWDLRMATVKWTDLQKMYKKALPKIKKLYKEATR